MADGGGMDPADDPRLNTQADAALDRLRSALAAAGEDPAAAVALVERLAAKAPSAAAGARTVGTEVAALLAAAELSAAADRLTTAGHGVERLLRVVAEAGQTEA